MGPLLAPVRPGIAPSGWQPYSDSEEMAIWTEWRSREGRIEVLPSRSLRNMGCQSRTKPPIRSFNFIFPCSRRSSLEVTDECCLESCHCYSEPNAGRTPFLDFSLATFGAGPN